MDNVEDCETALRGWTPLTDNLTFSQCSMTLISLTLFVELGTRYIRDALPLSVKVIVSQDRFRSGPTDP